MPSAMIPTARRRPRALALRLAPSLAAACVFASGCAAPAAPTEEIGAGESAVVTYRAEWAYRSGGSRVEARSWACVATPRVLCTGGALAAPTTTSSATAAPTWALDGATWMELLPAGPALPGRIDGALAFDEARGRAVAFGGLQRAGVFPSDTREWDGAAWTVVASAHAPAGRTGAELVADPGTGRLVLFGGRSESAVLRDVWEWDGVDWTERPAGTTALPDGRLRAVSVPARGEIVLVEERTGALFAYHDGALRKLPSSLPKSGRARLVLDEERQSIVALLESSGEVRVYEGRGDGDSLSFAPVAIPALRYRSISAAVYDAAAKAVVLVSDGYAFDLRWITVDNHAPALFVAEAPRGATFAGDPIEVKFRIDDPDDAAPELRITNLPEGATLDSAARTLRWTPRPDQAGRYTLHAVADDGQLTASRDVTLEVVWPDYPWFPKGAVDELTTGENWADSFTAFKDPDRRILKGLVSLPTSFTYCNRYGCRQEAPPFGHGSHALAACRFTGTNPGKVTATCVVNSGHAGMPFATTSTPVTPDGRFSAARDVQGRLGLIAGEGASVTLSGYRVSFGGQSAIRQTSGTTTLLRPMPQ